MTLEETVASILLQDAMPDLHKQYLVAVEQFLAPEIVADVASRPVARLAWPG